MAIASVGSIGIGAGSGAGTTVVFTPTAQLDAGNNGLLVFVTDNTSTSDAETSEHTSVVDSVGNTWTKLGEWCNGNGAAQAGITTSVWYTRATTNLTTAGTITCTLSTSGYDRCASAWEFTSGVKLAKGATNQNNAIDAANGFGSVAFSGLASKSRLYFRGLGKEANSTTVLTPSASFTVITPNRSRNNAAAVLVRGEFRINTSTGETSNPTLAVTGDTAGVFVALEETFSATAAVSIKGLTCSGSATFVAPFVGTAAVTIGELTASGTATFTAPSYTASAAVTIGELTASGTATFTPPVSSGTSTVTIAALTATGAATFVGPSTGTAAVTIGALTAAGVGATSAPHPVVQITRPRYGLAGRRYGEFDGKAQTPPYAEATEAVSIAALTASASGVTGAAHPVVRITQARATLAGQRYSGFAGKGQVGGPFPWFMDNEMAGGMYTGGMAC